MLVSLLGSLHFYNQLQIFKSLCSSSKINSNSAKKVLILTAHRSGSSLLGEVLSSFNDTSYYFEPLRPMENVSNDSYDAKTHWFLWSKTKQKRVFETLNSVFSCTYVSLEYLHHKKLICDRITFFR